MIIEFYKKKINLTNRIIWLLRKKPQNGVQNNLPKEYQLKNLFQINKKMNLQRSMKIK